MFVIVVCQMREFVLTTRLSNKDYSVKIHQSQTKYYTIKQMRVASLIHKNIQAGILHSDLFRMSQRSVKKKKKKSVLGQKKHRRDVIIIRR